MQNQTATGNRSCLLTMIELELKISSMPSKYWLMNHSLISLYLAHLSLYLSYKGWLIYARYNDKRWIPRDVEVTPSTRIREEKLLINREATTNTSHKEHVNSIPKSSDEREGSQLHNPNSKLLPSNSRDHVPQKVSSLVNNVWISEYLNSFFKIVQFWFCFFLVFEKMTYVPCSHMYKVFSFHTKFLYFLLMLREL